jgi:hypothetical protein
MNIRRSVSGPITVVISELYNNALEHGLLELDSGIKLLPGGFDDYLRLREVRLASLEKGYINVEIEQIGINERQMLLIHVIDSGNGFNYHEKLDYCNCLESGKSNHDSEEVTNPCHIGIGLAKSLCYKVEYLGKGNEVIAYYQL